ncbi:UPF0145 [Desulfonema limicola]|uniref:UPF0145 protein dnl_54700 n=1 Tax=Desulfonema limicola TaxID=45656 RepID=A0A975BCR6_9BACT|nr:YbjQ family protein [Desulfonema limicola]QTA83077.1 UPF0145 [Desulfonema limicola]
MSEKTYKLIFEGKIIQGHDPAQVKKHIKSLFKTSDKGLEHLFSGKPVVVKKNMDQKTAMKYNQAVKKAGGMCIIEVEKKSSLPEPESEPEPVQTKSVEIKQKPVSQTDEPEMIHCPSCNYKQKKSHKCIMCGAAIEKIIHAEIEKPKPVEKHAVSKPKLPGPGEMILTNIESVPGFEILEHFGLVSGSTIRAKHIGRDIMASLKNLIGGELKGYTQLLQESRNEAVERMQEQARQLGANAVINIRFSTSSVAQGAAELYAYGTAVRIE